MTGLRWVLEVGYYGAIMYMLVKIMGFLDVPFWLGLAVVTCCGLWFATKVDRGEA